MPGEFQRIMRLEKAEQLFRPAFGRPPASDEELKDIRRYDPFPKLKAGKPRPILLLHGDADTTYRLKTHVISIKR
jgi:hypothetical protein